MNKLIVFTSLVLAVYAGASICSQEYHLQEAYQIIVTGTSPGTMVAGAPSKIDKGMNAATLLNDSIIYKILTDWDSKGACDSFVERDVNFAFRQKGTKTFVPITEKLYTKFFNGEDTLKKPGWTDFWFGFASNKSEPVLIEEDAGKFKNQTSLITWYGAATMKLTTHTSRGTSVTSGYLKNSASHPDSATLIKDLLSVWKDIVPRDTQTLEFTVQLIKVSYDTLPTPVTQVVAQKPISSRFQANQTGNLVLIKFDEKETGMGPIGLYNMMGSKVVTLHPTGYLYQWNGKTAVGADAQTGVYFVQSGSKILGKFFYSR